MSGLLELGITDAECCEQVGGGGRAGSIVCCNGRVIPCAWDHEKDPATQVLKNRATLIHEGVHAKDSTSKCKPGVQDGYAGVPNLEASECKAYSTELPWLEKGYDECPSDYCKREFYRQIRFTCAPQNNDPQQGDWMSRYCRQAGMQVPAEAQRICKRFSTLIPPPAQPPREIVQKGAPILEYATFTDTPTSLSPFKAPTIEYPLGDEYDPSKPEPMRAIPGGKKDQSGKCPDGWSYTILDGVGRCRNNATGEFRDLTGGLVGLLGLADMGATKKKKVAAKPKPRPMSMPSYGEFPFGLVAQALAPVGVAGAAYLLTKSPLLAVGLGIGTAGVVYYFASRKIDRAAPAAVRPGTTEQIPNY